MTDPSLQLHDSISESISRHEKDLATICKKVPFPNPSRASCN